jgi:hypothetical protein
VQTSTRHGHYDQCLIAPELGKPYDSRMSAKTVAIGLFVVARTSSGAPVQTFERRGDSRGERRLSPLVDEQRPSQPDGEDPTQE